MERILGELMIAMPRSAFYSHRRTCHPSTATASHDAAARTSPSGRPHDHQPDHETESGEPETSKRRSGGIEGRGFVATPRSRKARFLLAFPDMLFDQGRACGNNVGHDHWLQPRTHVCR
jgi:hypothetical protein